MRSTLRILAFMASFAALLVVGGGHWAAFQAAAWARMIVTYTHDSGSLRTGLVQTFDGVHPCKFCRQISVGIEKEKSGARQKSGRDERIGKTNLVTVLPATSFAPFVRQGNRLPILTDHPAGRAADAPPVPPPRVA